MNPAVQAKKCLEVCRKYGKPVIVMEPVKGGNLVNLPAQAKKFLDDLNGGSPASYAVRFAAGCEGVFMTLSGMSNLEQMEDNISYMKDFQPLNKQEMQAVKNVCEVFKSMKPLYSLQILHCRLPQKYIYSRFIRLHEHKKYLPRPECRLLLQ